MSSAYVPRIGQVRMLAFLALLGIQQAIPAPLVVTLVVTAVAAAAGAWAVATLRR
jgi:hypothetical protein